MQSIFAERQRRLWILFTLRSEQLIIQLVETVRTPGCDRDFTLLAKHFLFPVPALLIRIGTHHLTRNYLKITKRDARLGSHSFCLRVLSFDSQGRNIEVVWVLNMYDIYSVVVVQRALGIACTIYLTMDAF